MLFQLFDKLVEERIQAAMDEGQFKNLPGEGKPIELSDYDFLNPDVWVSNKILKNAGYLPPWIELAWDIDSDERRLAAVLDAYRSWLAAARRELLPLTAAGRAQRRPAADLIFHGSIAKYVRIAEPLRDKIENFNVMCPIRRLEKVNLWVDFRVEQLEAEYAVLCRDLGWEPPKAQAVTESRKAAQQERERDAERARRTLEAVRQLGALQQMRKQLDWVAGTGSAKGLKPRFLRWRR